MRYRNEYARSYPWILSILLIGFSPSATSGPEGSHLEELIQNLEALEATPNQLEEIQRKIQDHQANVAEPRTEGHAELESLEKKLREIELQQQEISNRLDLLQSARDILSDLNQAPLRSAIANESGVDFSRDIKPILSNRCYTCHGPDATKRKAGLRFDLRDPAFAPLQSGGFAIVPGDPTQSKIIERVSTHDDAEVMPPSKSGDRLTQEEVHRLTTWISEGAAWEDHWSFVAPRRPAVPQVIESGWVKNEIDAFVLRKLEESGMRPSKEAQRETLIRRVSLDLTGLPPTLEEQEKFLGDTSPIWYESMVDHYLASKHFGERMAVYWLDLARYADSDGYHIDYEKSFWQYRDWVIQAYNNNKPFDEFTIEQLAGDLLPDPRLDQLVATAFNRNGMTNTEGGADAKEYLTKYVIDRVVTTSTVWLGLTLGCAECHEHKYDPITHEEFYQFYDFFNQIPEVGLDKDPCPPFIKVPSEDQQSQLNQYTQQMASLETRLEERLGKSDPGLEASFASWSGEAEGVYDREWEVIDDFEIESEKGTRFEKMEDGSLLAISAGAATDTYTIRFTPRKEKVSGFRLEALPDTRLPVGGTGLASNGNFMLSEVSLTRTRMDYETTEHEVRMGETYADFEQSEFRAKDILDGQPTTGWAVLPQVAQYHRLVFNPLGSIEGGENVRLTLRLKFHHIAPEHLMGRFRLSVTTEKDPDFSSWSVLGPLPAASPEESFTKDFGPETEIDLTKTYLEGDLRWVQKPEWEDGKIHDLEGSGVSATYLYRTVYTPKKRKLLFSFGSNDGIQVWLNGVSILSNDVGRPAAENQEKTLVELQPGDNRLLLKVNNRGGAHAFYFRSDRDLEGTEGEVSKAFRVAEDQRTPEDLKRIHRLHRLAVDPEAASIDAETEALREKKTTLESAIPTLRIMQDMVEKRPTHVLVRGDYRKLGEQVTAGVPAFLPDLPEGEPVNRLALAKWLVSDEQPLTSRVTVNRLWALFFGTGLVKTSEDFGTQGEVPSHPELLDWLAVEFRESGWDTKSLIRKMLLSATYRQDSAYSNELLEKDPRNRMLAKGPRRRLPAEMIRDNALAIAGLLDRERAVGGPSVRPYQPPDLWKEKAIFGGETANYVQSTGGDVYRRGLYTFWKRSVPYPSFIAFDAPSREVCTAQREVTNTPLQAFVTLNEKTYLEAARNFAQRILMRGGESTDSRYEYAFEVALARQPTKQEIDILNGVLDQVLTEYQSNEDAAAKLLSIGESAREDSLDRAEHAAWTAVANVILNLDETMTKE